MSVDSFEPQWLDRLPERSSEAEDPGYKIDPASIVDLLPRLRKRDQQLIDLYMFQGLSQREVGEQLGVTQPSVCMRLRHVYALLKFWAGLPDVGTEAEIRHELRHINKIHVDVLVAMIEGTTILEFAEREKLIYATVYQRVRKLRQQLPEKYQGYVARRPPWPSNHPKTKH